MKNLLTFVACFLSLNYCLGQQLRSKNNTIVDNITERYKVAIDTNEKETIVGDYNAYNGRKLVAKGQYTNGKRTGVWFFYDANGKGMQHFNYDTDSLLFENHEPQPWPLRCQIDYPLRDSDHVTPPFRIGGRFFGYLPYVKAIRRIHALRGLDLSPCQAVLTILVSPLGRLANCTIELECAGNDPVTFVVNTDDLTIYDKTFVPATLNGQKIAATLQITCHTNTLGEICIN